MAGITKLHQSRRHRIRQLRVLIARAQDELWRLERQEGLNPAPDAVQEILHRHARAHDVTVEQIISKSRLPDVDAARRAALVALREQLGLSYPQIGRIVDRDHSTVMATVQRVQARRLKAV